MKFVPKGVIDNSLALVQIMAWCRTSDKPLSESMVAWFNNAYMRHPASMSSWDNLYIESPWLTYIAAYFIQLPGTSPASRGRMFIPRTSAKRQKMTEKSQYMAESH